MSFKKNFGDSEENMSSRMSTTNFVLVEQEVRRVSPYFNIFEWPILNRVKAKRCFVKDVTIAKHSRAKTSAD